MSRLSEVKEGKNDTERTKANGAKGMDWRELRVRKKKRICEGFDRERVSGKGEPTRSLWRKGWLELVINKVRMRDGVEQMRERKERRKGEGDSQNSEERKSTVELPLFIFDPQWSRYGEGKKGKPRSKIRVSVERWEAMRSFTKKVSLLWNHRNGGDSLSAWPSCLESLSFVSISGHQNGTDWGPPRHAHLFRHRSHHLSHLSARIYPSSPLSTSLPSLLFCAAARLWIVEGSFELFTYFSTLLSLPPSPLPRLSLASILLCLNTQLFWLLSVLKGSSDTPPSSGSGGGRGKYDVKKVQ